MSISSLLSDHISNNVNSLAGLDRDGENGWSLVEGRKTSGSNVAKRIYGYTKWVWVLLALFSLVLQGSKTVDMSEDHKQLLFWGELAVTIMFDFEIVLRFFATMPDWRTFFQHGNNWLDLLLAIVCSIIQIPAIHESNLYPWFTIFQLARFYRVILVIPRMKPLLVSLAS